MPSSTTTCITLSSSICRSPTPTITTTTYSLTITLSLTHYRLLLSLIRSHDSHPYRSSDLYSTHSQHRFVSPLRNNCAILLISALILLSINLLFSTFVCHFITVTLLSCQVV